MGWQDRQYSEGSSEPYAERPGSISGGRVFLFRVMGISVRADLSLWIFIAWILLAGQKDADLKDRVAGAIILFVSVLLHEFGHCFAARWVGGSANEILLGPMGGLAMVNTAQRPWVVFVSTAGGPAVNLLLCAATSVAIWLRWGVVPPFGPFDGYMPSHLYHDGLAFVLWWVGSINRLLLYFNLLPILPMDGGRILYCLLWPWMTKARAWAVAAWVGIFGAIAVTVWVVKRTHELDPLFAYIMLSNVFFCGHQIRQYRAVRASTTSTDAYNNGEAEETSSDKRGRFARWRDKRAENGRRRAEEKIDAILAKVSSVGMDGLSSRELKLLRTASKRRQAAR